jgi:hypothetical protein
MSGEADPISREEILFRRVGVENYDKDSGLPPSDQAFRPRSYDTAGISLFREKHKTLQEAAKSPSNPDKKYFVAKLKAGALMDEGLTLAVDPSDISHVFISNLTYANRGQKPQLNWQAKLAHELCEMIDPDDLP